MKIITFLSDFGDSDWFVAAVKGEISKINKNAVIVDITHKLPPHDIRSAAFVLKSVYKNFPIGTVHLAIVDPGVGSKRKSIIVESAGCCFVGPDNGVFSYIYDKYARVYKIAAKKTVSATFQARDIFGPAAARLTKGFTPGQLGTRIKNYIRFEFPEIRKRKSEIYGEVVYIDHFGNLITNIPDTIDIKTLRVLKKGIPVKCFYEQGKPDEVICIRGSSSYYEIVCNRGSALEHLGGKVGLKVVCHVT